ncbi:MAG: hypothetical protein SCK29_06135 [Bacillota bacterium]|nr:hypothetical protein [Bacillota bacterium]MDW7683686.1 hypothetical protein [Bacillota bacterium]
MYRLRVLDTKTVLAEGLMETIIDFDKNNMANVLEKAETPNERRHDFTQKDIYILAFTDDDMLAGYLECVPCVKDGEETYLTSMQIDRRHRQSILISQILLRAKRDLMRRSLTN